AGLYPVETPAGHAWVGRGVRRAAGRIGVNSNSRFANILDQIAVRVVAFLLEVEHAKRPNLFSGMERLVDHEKTPACCGQASSAISGTMSSFWLDGPRVRPPSPSANRRYLRSDRA